MEKKETIEEVVQNISETKRRRTPRKNTRKEVSKTNTNMKKREVKKQYENEDSKIKETIEKKPIEERKRRNSKFEFKKDNLKIIPLGGLDEIEKI